MKSSKDWLSPIPDSLKKHFVESTKRDKKLYMSEEQIVKDLLYRIRTNPESLDDWMKLKRDHVGMLHHGLGTKIRNYYGLWDPKNPHVKVNAKPNKDGIIDDPKFPDQVSHRILTDVWDVLHG